MISLKDYIIEELKKTFIGRRKMSKNLNNILFLIKEYFGYYKIDNNHPKELCRGPFGEDNEEFYNNICRILNRNHISYKIENDGPYSYPGSLKDSGASNEYMAIKVILDNGEYCYITNTSKNKKNINIKSKLLTPDGLGLAPDKNSNTFETYIYENDIDKLLDHINNELDEKLYKYKEINTFCKGLLSSIKNNKVIGDTAIFDNIDNFNTNNIETTIKIDFNKELDEIVELYKSNTNLITEGDIKRITNDFGEVLGAIIFMKLFKDIPMSFPIGSNNPLVDYYIGNIPISAKANTGGGRPAGTKSFIQAYNIYKDVQQDGSDQLKELYTEAERNMFKEVIETYNMDTQKQQCILIQRMIFNKDNFKYYKKYNADICNNIIKLFDEYSVNINNFTSEKDVVNEYIHINNLKDFLTDVSKYTNKKIEVISISDFINNLNDISMRHKYAFLIYMLFQFAVDLINDKYSKYECTDLDNEKREIDAISRILQRTQFKQAYLNIDMRNKQLVINIHSSSASNWKIISKLSYNNIYNSKLSIQMKK